MGRLTKRLIESAETKTTDYILWDGDVTGFGCRVFPSGKRGYLVQYRIGKRTRRLALGLHGRLTVDEARKQAKIRLGEVAKGGDPSEDRTRKRKSLTVTQLCDDYLKACDKGLILGKRKRPKKASTVSIDRGRIARHIKPLLGNIRVVELKRDDVERFMRDVAKGKSAADVRPQERKETNGHKGNKAASAGKIVYSDTVKTRGRAIITGGRGTATRTIGLLGSILSFAVSEGVCAVNVAHGIKTFGHDRRRMVLAPEQYRALGVAIEVAAARPDDAKAAAILRLIALTGLRRGEAVGLKKSEANEAGRCIALADSKEGENVRPVGSPAFDLLRTQTWDDKVYVFPGDRKAGAPYAGFPKAWRRILEAAEGLPRDLTPHGLRHAYASVANELGFTEATIGALLGHSGGKSTTSRYTHHVDAVLAAAADRVARRIDAMMTGRQAEVVQLPAPQAARS
jgi:site-specific recombinase XerD